MSFLIKKIMENLNTLKYLLGKNKNIFFLYGLSIGRWWSAEFLKCYLQIMLISWQETWRSRSFMMSWISLFDPMHNGIPSGKILSFPLLYLNHFYQLYYTRGDPAGDDFSYFVIIFTLTPFMWEISHVTYMPYIVSNQKIEKYASQLQTTLLQLSLDGFW